MTWTPPPGPVPPVGDPPGPPGSPVPEPPGRGLTVLAAVAVVVLLALAGLGTALALTSDVGPDAEVVATGVDASDGPDPDDPDGPGGDGWDPRLEELAEFVADARGRPFLEPVPVEFLDDDAFRDKLLEANGDMTDEEREALDASTTQLRALGLLGPDDDLLEQIEQLLGEGTLAFYDTETDAITVRGTDLDVATRVTVVHELTHAWQDQHLGLDRLEDLEDAPAANLRTLAEGDASRMEDAYLDGLSQDEQREHARVSMELAEAAQGGLDGVPDVLQASFASPYALGPPYVTLLEAEGGNAAVDAAMADPPGTDLEILDPTRFSQRVEVVEVEAPALTDGQELLDEGPFGALSLVMVLAERIDPREALTVGDGWAGDVSLTYRDGDVACVVIVVAGEDGAATDAIADAFTRWAARGPDGAATAETTGDRALLRSCEPDGGAVPSGERVVLALQYAALRLTLFQQILTQAGLDVDEAACFAQTVTDQVEPEELLQGAPVSAEDGQRRGSEAAAACIN